LRSLLLVVSWTGELILLIRTAVPGVGSSSSDSGNGVGLISSRPVLEGREFCWPPWEPLVKGGIGDSCEDEEEMGLPSIRTSVSESRSSRNGSSFVFFSLRSISMRESRLLRSRSSVGEPGEGQCSGV